LTLATKTEVPTAFVQVSSMAFAVMRYPTDTHNQVTRKRREATVADSTEAVRRQRIAEINAEKAERASLEARHGKIWDTGELADEFSVIGFMAPCVVVRRRCDGVKGSLEFQHQPRFYFNFKVA